MTEQVDQKMSPEPISHGQSGETPISQMTFNQVVERLGGNINAVEKARLEAQRETLLKKVVAGVTTKGSPSYDEGLESEIGVVKLLSAVLASERPEGKLEGTLASMEQSVGRLAMEGKLDANQTSALEYWITKRREDKLPASQDVEVSKPQTVTVPAEKIITPETQPPAQGQDRVVGENPSPATSPIESQTVFKDETFVQAKDGIQDLFLQRLAAGLDRTPAQVMTLDYLTKTYLEIQTRVNEGKTPEGEAIIIQERISRRIQAIQSQTQPVSPDTTQQDRSPTGVDSVINSAGQRLEQLLPSGEAGILPALAEQTGVVRNLATDPETGMKMGMELLPDAREAGAVAVKDLFRQRLRILIEENAEQSFDQNWRLVYPLELVIMSLMPRRGEADMVGPDGAQFSLSGLRKELSRELQAYRNIHNFIYVYRRVGGVTQLIEAGALLPRETLNVLLRTPEVADRLRKMEALGERSLFLKRKQYQGLKLTPDEDGELRTLSITVKDLTVAPSSSPGFEGNFWANRVAGGLYSGLHESARHDLQANEAGDFFSDRLFHTKERVKGIWEDTWKRTPRPSLYNALDLGVIGFWERILGNKIGSFRTVSEAQEYCDSLFGLNSVVVDQKMNNKRELRPVLISFNLSTARFEDFVFSESGQGTEMSVKTDEVRQVNLDLDDADKIRKAIVDPKMYLDEPSLGKIAAMWPLFKHLKGEARSGWVAGLVEETILLFRPRYFKYIPFLNLLPKVLAPIPGREIYPDMERWSAQKIESSIKDLTPPLTKNDADALLSNLIAPKLLRGTAKGVRLSWDVFSSVTRSLLQNIFNIKTK